MPLLNVKNLRTAYESKGQKFYAVDGVSFDIREGETVGLVGESGSGKSTLGKTIARLIDPAEGQINLQGQDVARLRDSGLRPLRKTVQMVFQDPYSSLNPRHTVYKTLETPLIVHGKQNRRERLKIVSATLEQVGLGESALHRYPNEFSGGQRQRIGIARALILQPKLMICDEPVSALDLSIQAQILNLLVDVKKRFGLSLLFISHDLSVVRYISDRVLVMYLGKIVEAADQETLWREPRHPYTKALLASVPSNDPAKRVTMRVAGEIAQSLPAGGCGFRDRCPFAVEKCATETPALRRLGNGNAVACHLA